MANLGDAKQIALHQSGLPVLTCSKNIIQYPHSTGGKIHKKIEQTSKIPSNR
jgi:hypothetical protein